MAPQLQAQQPCGPKRRSLIPWTRLVITAIALLLIAVGVIVSIAGYIPGFMTLTVLGIVIGLFQWLFPIHTSKSTSPNASPSIQPTHIIVHVPSTPLPSLQSLPSTQVHSPPVTREEIIPPVLDTITAQPFEETAASSYNGRHRIDWGEAPHITQFYGREKELADLEQWIQDDRCRLIAVLGIGGMGKTALAAQLVERLQEKFDSVFWRSLQNAPPLESILKGCLQFLSNEQRINLSQDEESQISLLLQYLRERRCLLVLDNMETILQAGSHAGKYREGYSGYGRLIQRLGEANHQSCLLLTSREKPKEVVQLEGKVSPVRSLPLHGLGQEEGRSLLKDEGLLGSEETWATLIHLYSGNPLALKLASEPIRELFEGNVVSFLKKGEAVVADLSDLLDQQFQRLTEVEQAILYWLAIEREAVSLDALQEDMVYSMGRGGMLEALKSLRRRSMIETSGSALFTLQPVILEYITDRFVEEVLREIEAETFRLLGSHALIKAQARDYVRESQVRLILKPVAEQLQRVLGKEQIEKKCRNMLSALRAVDHELVIYGAGNILNLLVQLKSDLRGYDFSSLRVRQAYLQGVALPRVSFASADLATCIFTETFGGILSISFSPNGEVIAAGTTNDEILLWQAANGILLDTFQGHTDWVNSVLFNPDGTILVSGSDDRTVRLWVTRSGQLLEALLGYTDTIESVAFSRDGKLIAAGGEAQTIWLWDASSGQHLKTIHSNDGKIRTVAFSPDSTILASGGDDQLVRFWDIGSERLVKAFRGHSGPIKTAVFSLKGTMLASGGDDKIIRLWDVATGQLLMALAGHNDYIWSLAFSPDGSILASGSEDQTVCFWDTSTGQLRRAVYGHTGRIRSVAFSPDGSILASGSEDQTVCFWDVHTGQLLKLLHGYSNRIRSVAFSPDGNILVSGSEDQMVRFWNAHTGQLVRTLSGHGGRIRSVAFSPDGNILASASEDKTIRLWDAPSGQLLRTLYGHSNWVMTVAFHPGGSILASCSEDQTVRLWDPRSGQPLRTLSSHVGRVVSVAFNHDGSILASGGQDQIIRLWNGHSYQLIKELYGHDTWIKSLAFSPDGSILASGDDNNCIRIWDAATGQLLKILHGDSRQVRFIAFSPNNNLLVSGGDNRSIQVWDVQAGQLYSTLLGHNTRVRSVAFSPDGVTLVSGSSDGLIKFWDLRSGECLRTLRSERPYEHMNITGVKGLTASQKVTLRALGAIEE